MLTLGGRPLSVDLLMHDYSGHLFPGGLLIAWLQHPPRAAWTGALPWSRSWPCSWSRRSSPGWCSAGCCPVRGGGCRCWRSTCSVPLALWPTQWWAVAIQYLPVCIFLFLATWALLHRLQEGSRWSGPLAVLATAAGLLFQERAVLYPRGAGLRRVAFAEAVGLRRLVVAFRAHLVVWVPLARCCSSGTSWLHRELAPIDSTSPGSAAASAELVGNFVARNAVPGLRRGTVDRPGTEHHRGPDRLGGGSELGRPRRGRGPHAAPVPIGGLGLAAAPGLHRWLDVVLLFGGRTGPDFGEAMGLIPRYSADIVPGPRRRPRPGGPSRHGRGSRTDRRGALGTAGGDRSLPWRSC